MLTGLRRPYLNVDSGGSTFARQSARNLDLGGTGDQWSGIKHLNNEERDQIDLQSRLVLSRCADRVKEMETLEKRMYRGNTMLTRYYDADTTPKDGQNLSQNKQIPFFDYFPQD